MNNKMTKSIAYIALMIAINIIFVLGMEYLPLGALVLFIVLPLGSALVSVNVDIKYILIYFFISLGASLLINFSSALFYVFPSLISGILSAFLIRKKVNGLYIVLICSLINMISEYLTILIINAIFNTDFILGIANIINLSEVKIKEIYLLGSFLISLIQNILSYSLVNEQLKKFKIEVNESYNILLSSTIILGITLSLGIIFFFFFKPICYVFIALSIVLGIYNYIYIFKGQQKIIKIIALILNIISLIITFILLATNTTYDITIFMILFIGSSLISDIILLIKNKNNMIKL